jgi:hypothetical protein
LLQVAEKDVEARAGADVSYAVTHGSGAEDCNSMGFRHKRVLCESEV